MNEGLQMLDMLVLLALAVFFITRLRKILGKQIDDPKNPPRNNSRNQQQRVIHLRDVKNPNAAAAVAAAVAQVEDDAPLLADIGDPDVSKGLMDIKSADPGFNVREFLNGAKMAFEMIVDAFAKGDKIQLRGLLSTEIYADFEEAIEEAKKSEVREETTLVSIQSADIVKAKLSKSTAEVTVSFVSEQIIVERDKEGNIVAGDPSMSELVTDEWTFSREVRTNNPNWVLVAT
ncbi:MAG: Tim44/TimA family putative adaptor protein [Alphaproteobacteria bacterium]|nr:Tim44/TimA family putative adaptor protein [Alphaproteobacteria bacterium]